MEKAVSWKKILIFAIAVCLFAGIIVKCNQFQKTPLASYKGQKYEKAVVTKIIKDNLAEDGSRYGTQKVLVKITTGTYKGKEISVMGGGMGMPSIGIYSYELFNFYGVDQIIRIGSAGALQDHIKVMDVVIGMGACTDSNYAYQYGLPGTFAPIADYELMNKAIETAKRQGTNVVVGNVVSSDVFYNADPTVNDRWRSMGVLAVEMEAAALYMNAAKAKKKALCMLTISDHIYTGEALCAEDRQLGFGKMMEIALELA